MTPRDDTVKTLRELWPHLNWAERWTWVGRLVPLFDGDWAATVDAVVPGWRDRTTSTVWHPKMVTQ